MKILHSLSILILPFLFTGHASAETAPKAPNILFLLSDDHSYPYLGICNSPGSENVKTPCLDQLGKEGLVCHRCYTAAPQCVPSRATLMTGKSPVAARMTRFSSPLPRDEVIYPELLRKQANYTTAIIGRSYHLDGSSPKGGEEIQEILTKHKLKTFLERVDLLKSCKDEEVAPVLDGFLENRPKDKPFYVWANFSDPHHVWTTGNDLRPDPATLKLPPQWLDTPEMRSQLADYCAEVNNLDRTVANVLAVLEKHKVTEETLVVFTGDNGAALPRGKGSLHEFGCHVPLIIRWPGKVKPSANSNTMLSGEDFAPTFLEAAGVAIPPGVTGKSFLPLLLGKEYAPRQYVFTERGPHASTPVAKDISNNAVDYSRAVTTETHRFIYNCTPWIPYAPVDSSSGPAWQAMVSAHTKKTLSKELESAYFQHPRPVYELYDLQKDPAELQNLAGKPEVAEVEKKLRVALAEKMILDYDYLPLPSLEVTNAPNHSKPNNDRRTTFHQRDKDEDRKLSRAEFLAGGQNALQEERFTLRDLDDSGDLSLAEYLPNELPAPREKASKGK